jgi:hypothetical protein
LRSLERFQLSEHARIFGNGERQRLPLRAFRSQHLRRLLLRGHKIPQRRGVNFECFYNIRMKIVQSRREPEKTSANYLDEHSAQSSTESRGRRRQLPDKSFPQLQRLNYPVQSANIRPLLSGRKRVLWLPLP